MRIALTREPGPALSRCELAHVPRLAIDVELAREQHRSYENALGSLGCRVRRIPAEPELPDAVFVEDAAVVLAEVAIVTRPGAPSRHGESASVGRALEPFRPLAFLRAPATLDGGDVLVIGQRIWIGRSARTNDEGIDQFRRAVESLGYRVTPVVVSGCLHLKSAVTAVADDVLLLRPGWVALDPFDGMERIEIDPAEPHAANALRIGDAVVHPASCTRTRRRLEARGIRVVAVDVSEIEKAEGGVTCCSLLVEVGERAGLADD